MSAKRIDPAGECNKEEGAESCLRPEKAADCPHEFHITSAHSAHDIRKDQQGDACCHARCAEEEPVQPIVEGVKSNCRYRKGNRHDVKILFDLIWMQQQSAKRVSRK